MFRYLGTLIYVLSCCFPVDGSSKISMPRCPAGFENAGCRSITTMRPLGFSIAGSAWAIGSRDGNDLSVVLMVMISKRLWVCQ